MDSLKTDDIIDYALPMIKIEKLLRQAHDLCLEGQLVEAREAVLALGVEARVLQHVLLIMDEKEKALYGNPRTDHSGQPPVRHQQAKAATEAIHGW